MKQLLLLISSLFINTLWGQILTQEDSLNAGLRVKNSSVAISGYGEVKAHYNATLQEGGTQLRRNILFIGYRFNSNIMFFSELEIENAKISNGDPQGEIGMEQLLLKFDINRNNYIVAGLFLPRIGFINENHLPNTFLSNDRPLVEQYIIPATWREIGVSYYGTSDAIPGLNYNVSIMNGLDASKFSYGTGISGGRGAGFSTSGRNIAVNTSLLYYYRKLRLQASSYFGGSVGMNNKSADSLGIQTGLFGTPVNLSEVNAMYKNKAITIKALASVITIQDADKINATFTNNTPSMAYGYYGEVAYDLLYKKHKGTKTLNIFSRLEKINLNARIPTNGIVDDALNQIHLISGIAYQPITGVMVKLDYHYRSTGQQNTAFIINPYPQLIPYERKQHLFNLGIAYSF